MAKASILEIHLEFLHEESTSNWLNLEPVPTP